MAMYRKPKPGEKAAAAQTRMKARRGSIAVKEEMEREEEAHFIFARYDRDRSGFIEEDELATCFSELAVRVNGRAKNKGEAEIREWVAREFRRADANQDGKLSFDEFVTYYNRFVGANRRQFADRYEMGRELGRGAFGYVRAAKDVDTGEQVAVKQVKKKSAQMMRLIRNEITIWEALDHPHLVKLLDVYESGGGDDGDGDDDVGDLLLVTQLMRGGDLFERLAAREGAFTEAEAIELARQILDGVAYLHDQGTAHCDLKPSNILVRDPPGEGGASEEGMLVRIADFGLSQTLAAADGYERKLTDVCGTPEYFAPELVRLAQGDAGEYGAPVDCWAVGCIVYELLCGAPPFQAKDEAVLYYKILENSPDFPKQSFERLAHGQANAAVELIRALTASDAAARLTAADALEHEWFNQLHERSSKTELCVDMSRWRSRVDVVMATNRAASALSEKSETAAADEAAAAGGSGAGEGEARTAP